MTIFSTDLIIRTAVTMLAALLLGNGGVVWFNHFPPNWYRDESNGPAEDGSKRGALPEALRASMEQGRQRLPSTPWKLLLTLYFGSAGLYLAIRSSFAYESAALLFLFIMMWMAVSDHLYHIVPDQLQLLLALTAFGFIPLHEYWWEPAAGLLAALILILVTEGLAHVLYHAEAYGGADIKFYLVVGLTLGREGVIYIFILTTLLQALHLLILFFTGTRRTERGRSGAAKSRRPMLPYAFFAATFYLLFFYGTGWRIFF